MPDLGTHERELKNTRREVRNLVVMQMQPGRSAEDLKHLAELERSARAEVKLRVKALNHATSQQREASPVGTHLMTPEQHRARAAQLRGVDPNSRAADLHEIAAKLRKGDSKGRPVGRPPV